MLLQLQLQTNTSDTSIVENYEYDKEKMSPFTGLELSPELWLKRPRRVIAFKVDNNLNARPQSGFKKQILLWKF